MLHTGRFNEHFGNFDEEAFEDDEEEEVDHYIKGPTVLNPVICPHCKKYTLEVRKYHEKDAANNVLHCKNCGYLCILCKEPLPGPSKHNAAIKCSNGHSL